jgi:uncharacterized protein (TIGR02266 family)
VSGESDDNDAKFEVAPGSAQDREQARFGVDCTVTIDSEHNFYAGTAQNLSEGGIFIATHIVHPIGTKFLLAIHLEEDGKPKVVRGVGMVRWIRAADEDEGLPAGLGIQFLELQGDGSQRIAAFLERRQPILMND